MDKMRQWTMLTLVGVVAIVAAGWFLVVSKERHKAAELRTQASTQQASNASLQSEVNQLLQQKNGLPAQQRKLAGFAQGIPSNPAMPTLIRQLSAAANSAGVDLVSLAPASPTLVQAAAVPGVAQTSATASAAAAAPQLAQIPVQIVVQGSYYNIELFFNAVEKMDRKVLVPGYTLSAAQGTVTGSTAPGTQALPPNTLKGQINAVVFESPTVAPPAASAAAPASAH